MKRNTDKLLSRYSVAALELMAKSIRGARIEQRITVQELADRAGISRGVVQRIEKADPGCAIGTVFELAAILGIPLFSADYPTVVKEEKHLREKLALLPKTVHAPKEDMDNDF